MRADSLEAWANSGTDNPGTTYYLEIIEVAPPPISIKLKEPAASPEPINATQDFAYLMPLPGSQTHNGQETDAPLRLMPKGADHDEIVANGSVVHDYTLKDSSQLLLSKVYRDALVKAGWDIEGEHGTEVTVAHYRKKGRNLWAYLLCHGSDYSIRVGKELLANELKTSLESQCHVALYGVLFDFNKSTLQAASDGPLQKVATLLAGNPSLQVEIQGHTDNVGADDYNRTLSEARAGSVVTWLIQHGVAASRMSAKGYGKTVPVADNATDEGRMKNRRVEIADPRCKASVK